MFYWIQKEKAYFIPYFSTYFVGCSIAKGFKEKTVSDWKISERAQTNQQKAELQIAKGKLL